MRDCLIGSVLILLLSGSTLQAATPKKDLEIAKASVALAKTHLSKDKASKDARVLLGLCRVLDPDSDDLIVVDELLRRGKLPAAEETSSAGFSKLLYKRASYLLKSELPKNGKSGQLCLLYYRVLEHFHPRKKSVISGLARLQGLKLTASLNELLKEEVDLEDVHGNPEAPEWGLREAASEDEKKIASAAVVLGRKRLSKDLQDSRGLALLRLGGALDPCSSSFNEAISFAVRGIKPEPSKRRINEDRFISALISRGKELVKNDSENATKLALLYAQIGALFKPDDSGLIVIQSLAKKQGVRGELDDLLNEDFSVAKTEPEIDERKEPDRKRPQVAAKIFKKSFKCKTISLSLSLIKPGEFRRGVGGPNAPQQQTIGITKSYWLASKEITNGLYNKFVQVSKYDGSKEAAPNYLLHHRERLESVRRDRVYPVVFVSWRNAMAFCKWLTEAEGKVQGIPDGYEFRLPTDAEWEHACRAGTETLYHFGNEHHKILNYSWFHENSRGKLQRCGGKRKNPFGLYDMYGNVAEWVLDAPVPDFYRPGRFIDPVSAFRQEGEREFPIMPHRRIRGGAYSVGPEFSNSYAWHNLEATACLDYVGFRVALAPKVDEKRYLPDEHQEQPGFRQPREEPRWGGEIPRRNARERIFRDGE